LRPFSRSRSKGRGVAWKEAIVFAWRLYRMGKDPINAKTDQALKRL